MSTGMTIEERLQIVREVFMVIGHHKDIVSAESPKADSFYLVRAIVEDGTYSCTAKQRLIGILKKSPAWVRVRPFVKNDDTSCGRKGCQCSKYLHGNGPCIGSHHKLVSGKYTTIKCTCMGFIQKDFR